MVQRSRIFDDLTGVAGGAFSLLAGIREEVTALIQTQLDDMLSRLNLVRREEFEAVSTMASKARSAQEDLEERVKSLENRLSALEGSRT